MSIVILRKIRYNNTVRHKGVFSQPVDCEGNMYDKTGKIKGLCVLGILLLVLSGCGSRLDDGLTEIELAGENEKAGSEDAVPDQTEDTEDKGEETEETLSRKEEDSPEAESVFVYVCGAVKSPGVYELKSGARVYEAIELAGGVTGEAAQELLNQAEVVSDGERIYVPDQEEAEAFQNGTGGLETGVTDGSEKGKININTAGKDELMTLTGIGEAKAESILRYREENGKFGSIEELMQVEGIKEGVFNKIKDDITI